MAKNANLGSLNFELVLENKKFNTAIESATKAAKDLNITLSNLLDFRRRVTDASGVTNRLAQALREESRQLDNGNTRLTQAAKLLRNYNREKSRIQRKSVFTDDFAKQNSLLGQLNSAAAQYVSIWGAGKLVKSIAEVTGEFELQRMTLRAMLNDAHAADQLYGQIWDLALKSPFNAKELVTYANQLVAYSVPMNEIYETTKMLADVSSGLGVGMDRLILAYGQIRSASFLRGQEVRQLTETGIPILEELRKQFVELGEETITVGDVFDKISQRLVPFEMVQKVFKNMTSEGGKFFEMQEKQSETLKGKIMILKDAYDKMLNSIGSDNSSTLRGAVDGITKLLRNYKEVVAVLKTIVIGYGSYRAALALVHTAQKTVMAVNYVQYLLKLKSALEASGRQARLFARASRDLGLSLKTIAPIVAVIVAIGTAIATAVQNANKLTKELRSMVSLQFGEAQASIDKFNKLVSELTGNLGKAQKGSQNYRDAISELNNKYGEYLPNLLNEKNALDEIAASQDAVTNAIYARAKAYAKEEGERKIEEEYGAKRGEALANVIKKLEEQGIESELAKDFVARLSKNIEGRVWAKWDGTKFTDYVDSWLYVIDNYFKDTGIKPEWSARMDDFLHSYTRYTQSYVKAQRELESVLDAQFATSQYRTAAELKAVQEVEGKYKKLEAEIRSAKDTPADIVESKIKDNDLARLKELLAVYERLDKEAGGGTFSKEIKNIRTQIESLTPQKLTGFQAIVNPMVDSVNRDLKAQQEDSLSEYIERLRTAYKSVASTYDDAEKYYQKLLKDQRDGDEEYTKQLSNARQLYEQEKKRKALIESIGKALGISMDESQPASSAQTGVPEGLKTRIDTLKKIYELYLQFKDIGAGDESIRQILLDNFPDERDVITSASYRDELMRLASTLERFDKVAANSLRNNLTGKDVSQVYERMKDAKSAAEELQKALAGLFSATVLEGEGVQFDVSKVISDYEEQLRKVEQEKQAIMKDFFTAANLGADVDFGMTFDFLSQWEANELQDAATTAGNAMHNLAQSIFKDWAQLNGINLDDWGEMSVEQLNEVRKALDSLMDAEGNIKVSDSPLLAKLQDMLKDYPDLWEKIKEGLQGYVKGENKKVDGALKNSITKNAKYAAKSVLELTGSLKEMAEAFDYDGLLRVSEGIELIGEFASSVSEGYKAAGGYGAIAALLVTYVKGMAQYAAELEAQNEKIIELRREIQSENRAATYEVSNIFGADDIAGMKNALNQLDIFAKKYEEVMQNIDYRKVRTHKASFWEYIGWGDNYKSDTELGMKRLLESYGTDFDDPDSLISGLQTILNTYSDLRKSEQAYIKSAIADLEDYKKALEAVEEVASSLVDTVADSYVDQMIDNWYELGDAAVDYADILNDVTEAYVRMWLKSALLEEIFNDEAKDKVISALKSGNVAEFTAALAALLEEAGELTEMANKVFAQSGITQSGDSSSLSIAAQSLTEDTGNLIAAYMNGMRTDLSAQRQLVEGIGGDTRLLSAHIPTLDDYLHKIEANTYNASEATQSILRSLESVVGEGASSYVRVQ